MYATQTANTNACMPIVAVVRIGILRCRATPGRGQPGQGALAPLTVPSLGRRSDHLLALCRAVGASEYLSPTGSADYMEDDGVFAAKLQAAELDYVLHSEAGMRTIAENYVGLPLEFGVDG